MKRYRSLVRLAVVVALAGLSFVVGNLRLEAAPPTAAAWSLPLDFHPLAAGQDTRDPAGAAQWESARIRADVTLAGLSWDGDPPAAAWIRGSEDGETWTPWTPLVIDAEHGPDPGTEEAARQRRASEPAYLGAVAWVQFRVVGLPTGLDAEFVETAGRHRSLGRQLADLWQRLTWDPNPAGAAPGQPAFITRDVWGGDRCLGDEAEDPGFTDGVRAFFIHHTATAGSYSEARAPDVVYAICNYHVHTRGWRDIGYNFLVDVYGNIYEGRAGGVDQPVWGAHTAGFNYYSAGVGLIADYNLTNVGATAQAALVELASWKLDFHHVDPTEVLEIESLGSSRFEQGVLVTMPAVAGHRDASSTSCPGNLCYPLLGGWRPTFLEHGGVKILGGGPDVVPPPIGEMDFTFEITEAADWRFELSDAAGAAIIEQAGSGTGATITWDGMIGSRPAAPGEYRVVVTAGTASGETPRPVDRTLTWYRAPFRDDDTSVHEPSINAIAAAGVTTGCSSYFDWWYCPDEAVHRDQMASFLTRALGLEDSESDAFADDDGNSHEGAINAIADNGISIGCADGSYCPRLPVTRGEMASFLRRALDLHPATESYFTDVHNHPHEAAINAVGEAGISLGCGAGRFCPNDPVTRAQMASFLDRAFLVSP